jgi:hypothetical protein
LDPLARYEGTTGVAKLLSDNRRDEDLSVEGGEEVGLPDHDEVAEGRRVTDDGHARHQ